MRIVLGASLSLLALCLFPSNGFADDVRTIFIVDATAQMSAKLGQQRKIDWVKSAVAAAASKLDPSSSLALWAIGTTPAKKCEATGELVHIQEASAGATAVEKAIGALQPQAARSPTFSTVKSALTSLEPTDGKPVSIILVAGTGDDCSKDICASANELHTRYPSVKLTVLGMGMSEEATGTFGCAAKALGGSFTAIKSGTDLDRLFRQTLNIPQGAVQPKAAAPGAAAAKNGRPADNGGLNSSAATTAEKAAASSTATPATPEAKPANPPPPQPEPNVSLSAVPAAGAPPLASGVTWDIFKIITTPTGQSRVADDPVWTGGGGSAQIKLAEGRYQARASYGYASGASEFTIGGEKADKIVVLDAGTIAAEAIQSREGKPAEGAFFVLYRRKTAAALEELGRSSEVPALFQVNAGDYVLSAVAGLAKLEILVKVEAGKVSAVRLPLNIGELDLKTFAVEGASNPVPAWHQLYPASQNAAKGAIPLLRLAGAAHLVQLPAGSYRLQTSYGLTSQETIVQVEAGNVTSQVITLNAGEAKVSLPSPPTERICSVYEAGSDRKGDPIGRAAGAEMSFILKAGIYDVECRNKGAPAPMKPAQIRVVAGETQSTKIEE